MDRKMNQRERLLQTFAVSSILLVMKQIKENQDGLSNLLMILSSLDSVNVFP